MEVSTGRHNPLVVSFDTTRVLHETILALHQFSKKAPIVDLSKQMDATDNVNVTKEEEDDDVFEEIPQQTKHDSDLDDIDDIELVFTTVGTDPGSINEALVPIKEEVSRRNTLHTVVVETDISKCGVGDDSDVDVVRRNTLPVVVPYRPIPHREILGLSKGKGAKGPIRPVHKQESGAQTDLTALPEHSKSETYLARKMSSNLTTLPSKFALPGPRSKQLPLTDKTLEARRVLLSDINFTSMVPELSRSADHLHKDEDDQLSNLCRNYPGAFEYMKSCEPCQYHERNFRCHGSRSSWGSYYGSRCQSFAFHCHDDELPRRRHSWRPPNSPCCHARTIWSSVPSSPTRCSAISRSESTCHQPMKHPPPLPSHRRYHSHVHPGHSLPDLRDVESGESTDSLLDEAEDYVRKHIDAIVIGKRYNTKPKRTQKWYSDASIFSDFEPPKSAQPFLPRSDRDLKPGDIAKVIAAGSRVVVGIVRFCGPVEGKAEPYVGVELPRDTGASDGMFLGHRYFQCKPDHAIFVPFKKVVIAWNH